ncbi:uncharacterized protein C2845_PM18G03720 [Panicum miliaceum]|uniref:Uncharacterized protein n=1 Tax=Panicum miliaceum TaxID=4540 RepID=A0A3L6PM55_PANMI|nr:uncharacterized protein C2845_PM18G03720 [Panicum miliaceum]
MKKPSALLRSFSSRLSTRLGPSPAVAPWPPVRSAYDRWLAAEIDELRADPLAPCTSAAWLGRALGLAVAAQRRLVASASGTATAAASIDRKTVDECVDDTAELLDACAGIRDRLDMLRSYVTAMRIALHWLEGNGGEEAAARRAAAAQPTGASHQDGEEVSGARALALLAVGALAAALAFRPRRAVSGVAYRAGGCKSVAQWELELQEVQKHVREEYDRRRKDGVPCMAELEAVAAAGRAVRCAVAGGRRCPETVAAAARRRCDELEETVSAFEEKVGELHRELIAVRMVLLERAQRARGHELLRLPRI